LDLPPAALEGLVVEPDAARGGTRARRRGGFERRLGPVHVVPRGDGRNGQRFGGAVAADRPDIRRPSFFFGRPLFSFGLRSSFFGLRPFSFFRLRSFSFGLRLISFRRRQILRHRRAVGG
jgi:hypothetical protein